MTGNHLASWVSSVLKYTGEQNIETDEYSDEKRDGIGSENCIMMV